jgi:4-amino-4-deoxy-L-arabinose transferase-like glycosyltransferase
MVRVRDERNTRSDDDDNDGGPRLTRVPSPRLLVGAILVLSVVLLAIPAGRRPIYSQDEARQVLLARDVLERGHGLVAEVRGQTYLNKPQLYFWTIAAVSAPRGEVTEMTAALPALHAAVATVAAVITAARAAWSPATAALAGLLLVAVPMHFEMGHTILPDAMLTAWLTLALAAYLSAAEHGWPRGRLLLFYAAVAGGLLTKGPVALLAVLAALVATLAADGRAGLRRLHLGQGLVVLLVAALPWLVPYYVHGRAQFAQHTAYDQYVRWVLTNHEARESGDVVDRLTHLVSALPAFFPWTLVLMASALAWRRTVDGAHRRVIAWTLTLWIAIGLSGTFRARYLLPLYPCFALLVAHFVATATGRARRRVLAGSLAATGVLMVGAVAGLVAFGHGVRGDDRVFVPDATWERVVLMAIVLTGAGVALALVARSAFVPAAATLALTMAAVIGVEGVGFPLRYTRLFDLRPIATVIAREAGASAAIVGHPDLRLSYDVYLPRAGEEASSTTALRARLNDPAPAVIVTPGARWRGLGDDVPAEWRVVHESAVAGRPVVVVARPSR